MTDRINWTPSTNVGLEHGTVEGTEITLLLSKHYMGKGYTVSIQWFPRRTGAYNARPLTSDRGRKAPYSTLKGVKAWAEREVERALRIRNSIR